MDNDMSEGMVKDATVALMYRYVSIISKQDHDAMAEDQRMSLENLEWMAMSVINSFGSMPIDKMSRWTGFVQGCLAMRGLIDVDEEREYSRPMFHRAYGVSAETMVRK